MTLASVKAGDIVRSAGAHACVIERERGALIVRWLKSGTTNRVKAREVEAHWSKRR
jgi:ribosomal protein L2